MIFPSALIALIELLYSINFPCPRHVEYRNVFIQTYSHFSHIYYIVLTTFRYETVCYIRINSSVQSGKLDLIPNPWLGVYEKFF
jgi:hypothetical protein